MINDVFQKVDSSGGYRADTEAFYKNYFNDSVDMENFFHQISKVDAVTKAPRRMMNQVRRFVNFINSQDEMIRTNDPFKILLMRMCIESLCNLNNSESKEQRKKKNFFKDWYYDNQYILSNFELIAINEQSFTGEIDIAIFENVLFFVRNNISHDGDYWSFNLFDTVNGGKSDATITTLQITRDLFNNSEISPTYYSFRTSLTQTVFINFFVLGCIEFIKSFIDNYIAENPDITA